MNFLYANHKDDVDYSVFRAYQCNGCLPNARKRNRLAVYAVSADGRCSIDIYLANGLRHINPNRQPNPLKIVTKPWWMSQNQFQAMLTRIGVPF